MYDCIDMYHCLPHVCAGPGQWVQMCLSAWLLWHWLWSRSWRVLISALPKWCYLHCKGRNPVLCSIVLVVKVPFLIWKLPQDQANGYECTCALGFTGANCETNIDDCATSPCVNGTCVVSSYRFILHTCFALYDKYVYLQKWVATCKKGTIVTMCSEIFKLPVAKFSHFIPDMGVVMRDTTHTHVSCHITHTHTHLDLNFSAVQNSFIIK